MDYSNFDFGGYATRNDLLCGDGRVIRRNAFKECHGQTVPLIYNHDHNNPKAILGHAMLENREDGVYAYCKFNDTEQGQNVKKSVMHGDVRSLSIYANKLKHVGSDVVHGIIRELSVVLAGQNPGAYIDYVMAHSEDGEDGLIANYDESALVIYHSEDSQQKNDKEEKPMANDKERTVQEIYDDFDDEQKDVVHFLIGEAVKDALAGENDDDDDDEEGGNNMKHNVFDQDNQMRDDVISHSAMMDVISDAKKFGSMRESALQHGMTEIGLLYPEDHALNTVPKLITGDLGWVQKVMGGVHHTPFSKIKALFADITADEARARGYIKGKQKKEEVFALLKRTTSPQTVYKLQKMDRDDIIDIKDFDVVAFLKGEMRIKLDEELARAFLIGDGRLADDESKIKEEHIRPIWTDEELYAIHSTINVAPEATLAEIAAEFIDQAVRAREDYDGSGSPTAYMAENLLSACLLLKDRNGRRIYKDMTELATAMMVKEIVTVPPMKGKTRTDKEGKTRNLYGIIVNLSDYTVGADKGGAVNLFDDFDIDFNKYTYLIETRCSASLMKPKSAIVLETVSAAAAGE